MFASLLNFDKCAKIGEKAFDGYCLYFLKFYPNCTQINLMTIKAFYCILTVLILTIFVRCSLGRKTTQSVIATQSDSNPSAPIKTAETDEDKFLADLLKSQPQLFDSILAKRHELNVQIIYTRIDREKDGSPKLTTHYFNRKNAPYFYPASTVKFPIALLALQKIKELTIEGLNRNSTMVTDAAFSGQTAIYNDPNTADGRPTIAQYIKQIFLVSDNDAFNRLYEMLGQEYVNAQLHKKGYSNTQILHRLSIFLTEQENRTTNPVRFFDTSKGLLYNIPMQVNRRQYEKRNDFLGTGYYKAGKLINQPMDFSKKNRLPLEDLHRIMQSLIFPESVKPSERFDITEEDRRFVLQYMSEYPTESIYPYYDPTVYTDAYVKLILFGNDKGKIPPQIRSFSKSGTAYGQLTETAYIIDTQKNIEFLVSATINCNSDGIYNDDKYDYVGIGYPFMKNIGKLLYNYEANRTKKNLPDLSSMKFSYDK